MPNQSPAQLANLKPFQVGNTAARRSPHPERALKLARKYTIEAVRTAIECIEDKEAGWPDRLAAIRIILAEGLPKNRSALDALLAAGDGFIEVRFVDPASSGRPPPLEAERSSKVDDTFSVLFDAKTIGNAD